MELSKGARLEVFFRRLADAPPAASFDEAWQQIIDILNQVEDELTDTPFNPANWRTDGRLYPPLADSIRVVPEFPSVKRLRSREHNTFISSNGAVEIRAADGATLISKPGADGRNVFD